MNSYIENFFWVVSMVLLAMSVVHFVKIMKTTEKKTTEIMKAVVYMSGAILITLVLVYKPFDTSKMDIGKLSKFLKAKPLGLDTTATVITTTTSMGTSTGVGV